MAAWTFQSHCLLLFLMTTFAVACASHGVVESDLEEQHSLAERFLSTLKTIFSHGEGQLPNGTSRMSGFTAEQTQFIRQVLANGLRGSSQRSQHDRLLHTFHPLEGVSLSHGCSFHLHLERFELLQPAALRSARLHLPCHTPHCPTDATAQLSIADEACSLRLPAGVRRVLKRKRRQTEPGVNAMKNNWLSFNVANLLPAATSHCRVQDVYVNIEVSQQEQINCEASVFEVTRTDHSTEMFDLLQVRPTPLSTAEKAYLRRAVQTLHRTPRQKRSEEAPGCRLTEWTLTWTDIPGWNFVMAPTSTKIDLCSGSCHNSHLLPEGPKGRPPTTTNHALVRYSWRNTIRDANISQVKCVPIEWYPLDVIHLPGDDDASAGANPEETKKVEAKQTTWTSVQARRCGCR